MTRTEALEYLELQEDFDSLDLEDAVEEKLFEFKQYYLTKPVVSKLFRAQKLKHKKLVDAMNVLNISQNVDELNQNEIHFQGSIIDVVQSFEKGKATIKQRISNAKNVHQLEFYVEQLLILQVFYLEKWPMFEGDEGVVIIAKEPDIMDLLSEIRLMAESNVIAFEDVNISKVEAFPNFLNEWKRLSLLSKKMIEWKKESSIN